MKIWDKLPSEIKVAFYYAGVAGLLYVGEVLIGLKPIVWETFFRMLVGNILIVFVTKIKERTTAK